MRCFLSQYLVPGLKRAPAGSKKLNGDVGVGPIPPGMIPRGPSANVLGGARARSARQGAALAVSLGLNVLLLIAMLVITHSKADGLGEGERRTAPGGGLGDLAEPSGNVRRRLEQRLYRTEDMLQRMAEQTQVRTHTQAEVWAGSHSRNGCLSRDG